MKEAFDKLNAGATANEIEEWTKLDTEAKTVRGKALEIYQAAMHKGLLL
jgi:hypothetical protein